MHPSSDDSLSALLRRADPAAGRATVASPAFAAAVHARIHADDTALLRASRGLRSQLLPFAAALALIASIGGGSVVALAQNRALRSETFAAAYARSIDPWQMHSGDQTPPR